MQDALWNISLSLISGLIGVLVGCWLNYKSKLRSEQKDILKVLITYRYFPTQAERVTALNLIPVIFSKCDEVCSCFELFKKAHDEVTDNLSNQNIIQQKLSTLDDAYIKLIEEIAKELKYGSTISWDKIKKPYAPQSYNWTDGNTYCY